MKIPGLVLATGTVTVFEPVTCTVAVDPVIADGTSALICVGVCSDQRAVELRCNATGPEPTILAEAIY